MYINENVSWNAYVALLWQLEYVSLSFASADFFAKLTGHDTQLTSTQMHENDFVSFSNGIIWLTIIKIDGIELETYCWNE